jgi:PucR C-terminal helix-turn-helix domain/GGDEF-like domain
VVVGRLHARREELVRAIFARVGEDAFGRAGAEDAEYLAGLRATVAAALDYAAEGIEHGEQGAGPIPAVALRQARRAARGGVGLDTVLRRYAAGQRLMSDFVMTEADGLSTQALRRVLGSLGSLAERLMAAVSTEYMQEAERAGRSPEQRRSERVRRLLAGGPDDADDLGYQFDAWHLGAIVVGRGAGAAIRELAAGVDRRLLSVEQGEQSVWAWLGGSGRLAFADVERVLAGMDGRIGARPPVDVVLALGEPARGIEGWRLTHRQSQAALLVALRRRARPGVLTRYGDVALLANALSDEALARALIDIYIAPLEDSRGGGPVLRETLRAYLAAERSVSSTAAALEVARKTVAGRLRTIEQRLGRTLHPCPAELEVALELDELAAAPLEPEGPPQPPGPAEISPVG